MKKGGVIKNITKWENSKVLHLNYIKLKNNLIKLTNNLKLTK